MPADSSRSQGRAAPADPSARGGGMGDIVGLLSRRVWIWAPIFGVVLAISVYGYAKSPVFYRSTTRVLVSRGERESSLNPRVRYLQWEEEVASEVETVFSQPVLEMAEMALSEAGIRDPRGEPVRLPAGQISAGPVRGSNVLEILYQNKDPDLAREGVAAITEAYMEYRRATRSAPEMDDYFRSQISSVRASLDDLGEERKNILQQAGLASLTEQRAETVNLLGSVQNQLVRVREQKAYAKSRLDALRGFRASGLSDVEYIPVFAADDTRNDIGMRALADALVNLRTRENELASRYTDSYPPLREVRNQIEGQRILIEEAADVYESTLVAVLGTWQAREQQLNDELQALEFELSHYPDREARLTQLNLEISTLQGNYRQLVTEYSAAGIQHAAAPSWVVKLYGSPTEPTRIHTGDLIRTLVIPLFALVISLGMAFIVDTLDPSVKTAGEAERIFRAPVLASVSRVGGRK